jgi:uncharacterized protein with HEPN domain
MQPEDEGSGALWDMFRYAQLALKLWSPFTRSSIKSDDLAILGLERVVQIIGEAANHVPEALQAEHPEIPWRKIIGMRHILVHRYAVIELDEVWQAVTTDSAELVSLLPSLLGPLDPEVPDDLTP